MSTRTANNYHILLAGIPKALRTARSFKLLRNFLRLIKRMHRENLFLSNILLRSFLLIISSIQRVYTFVSKWMNKIFLRRNKHYVTSNFSFDKFLYYLYSLSTVHVFLLSSRFFGISVACTATNNCVGKGLFGLDRLEKKKIVIHFFSLETVNDFDLEPDIYCSSSIMQNMQFCIFSRLFQFYWKVNVY